MASNDHILQVQTMESTDPPTYIEATNMSPPTAPQFLETKSCSDCGDLASYGNYCHNCGRLLVQTTQPMSSAPQLNTNNTKLPPITTRVVGGSANSGGSRLTDLPQSVTAPQAPTDLNTQRQTMVAIPSPVTLDTKHKYDMAYKVENRLIYDFEKVACCPWQVVGLATGVEHQLPWELATKGITANQWRDWMLELMENQKRAPSIVGCLSMFCLPGFIPQSILCVLFCPISMDHSFKWLPCCYGDWYAGLRKWQDDVNSVLNRNDMHVKLITYKPWQKAPNSKLHGNRIAGKNHDYEMSMMVISLTEDETEKLKMQSWDQGVNDTCTSGIGRVL